MKRRWHKAKLFTACTLILLCAPGGFWLSIGGLRTPHDALNLSVPTEEKLSTYSLRVDGIAARQQGTPLKLSKAQRRPLHFAAATCDELTLVKLDAFLASMIIPVAGYCSAAASHPTGRAPPLLTA